MSSSLKVVEDSQNEGEPERGEVVEPQRLRSRTEWDEYVFLGGERTGVGVVGEVVNEPSVTLCALPAAAWRSPRAADRTTLTQVNGSHVTSGRRLARSAPCRFAALRHGQQGEAGDDHQAVEHQRADSCRQGVVVPCGEEVSEVSVRDHR